MIMLDDAEIEALLEWLGALKFSDLDYLLFKHLKTKREDFTGAGSTIHEAAMDLVGWLEHEKHRVPALYVAIVQMTPSHARIAEFTVTRDRLVEAEARAAALGPRHAACCPGGVPVINRSPLRNCLQRLSGNLLAHDVVVVEGQSGLGRSHSWFLIQYVGSGRSDVKVVKVDLAGFGLKKQPLPDLFRYLTRVLNVQAGDDPTTDGVTGGTLAERYIEELCTRIQALPNTTHRPWQQHLWLVFDSIDGDRTPLEIKHFVMQLARERLNRTFEGCTIFLLGPDPVVALDDRAGQAVREVVTPFLEYEVETTASAINGLGAAPLNAPQLKIEIDRMKNVPQQGREGVLAVFELMILLRKKVRA